MRYRFRGLVRQSGKPVEGHVEADSEQMAYNALAEAGYLTERLWPDPKPLNQSPTPQAPQFSDALDSALDTSSTQVSFDDLTERYKGKRVWVIDRDKIRRRVAQVVDQAIAMSHHEQENAMELRERVAEAIKGMFGDNRNIASERPAENPAAAPAAASEAASGALEQQIQRLNQVVTQAEGVIATLAAAARRLGAGGGGGPRRRFVPQQANEPQNEVLLEIFKTNLELRAAIEGGNGTSPKPTTTAGSSTNSPPPPPPPPAPPTPQPRTPASAATS